MAAPVRIVNEVCVQSSVTKESSGQIATSLFVTWAGRPCVGEDHGQDAHVTGPAVFQTDLNPTKTAPLWDLHNLSRY